MVDQKCFGIAPRATSHLVVENLHLSSSRSVEPICNSQSLPT